MDKLNKAEILAKMQEEAEESFAETKNPAFTSILSFYVYTLRKIFESAEKSGTKIPEELYNPLVLIHNEITEIIKQPSESKSVEYILSEKGVANLNWLNYQLDIQAPEQTTAQNQEIL